MTSLIYVLGYIYRGWKHSLLRKSSKTEPGIESKTLTAIPIGWTYWERPKILIFFHLHISYIASSVNPSIDNQSAINKIFTLRSIYCVCNKQFDDNVCLWNIPVSPVKALSRKEILLYLLLYLFLGSRLWPYSTAVVLKLFHHTELYRKYETDVYHIPFPSTSKLKCF